MSRDFNPSTSTMGRDTVSVPITYPLTFSAWFYTRTASANRCVSAITNRGTANLYYANYHQSNGNFTINHRNGGTARFTSYSGVSLNEWHHMCAIYRNNSYRTIWIDGDQGGISTTFNEVPAGLNGTNVGYLQNGPTTSWRMDGLIAEAAIWQGYEPTSSEIIAMANGESPRLFGHGFQDWYLPIHGLDPGDPAIEPSFGNVPANTMEAEDAARGSVHPPISRRFSGWNLPPAVAPPTFNPAWASGTRLIGPGQPVQ